jgi:hypothetical protein
MQTIDRDFPGHFIGADNCRFRQTTDVLGPRGWVRVSTVGEYVSGTRDLLAEHGLEGVWGEHPEFDEIGYNRLYETMVFRLGDEVCDCGCNAPKVLDWSELDFAGYNTREDAEVGHQRMVLNWLIDGVAEDGEVA